MKIALIAITSLCLSIAAYAQERTLNTDVMGALSKSDAQTATEIANTDDEPAFIQFVLAHGMVLLRKGTPVTYAGNVDLFSSFDSIRVRGDYRIFWIPRGLIDIKD